MDKRSIFGLNPSSDDKFVLIPVPRDATASYHKGTSQGPLAILEASPQIDLYDGDFGQPADLGISTFDPNQSPVSKWNQEALASDDVSITNSLSEKTNEWVYSQTQTLLSEGKIVGILGGEHSVPFGAIKAISKAQSEEYGILHIDAHFDLREAYEGYTHSHASIFYNVMKSDFAPKHLVQIGLRDFCEEELQR